jgi:hypothetical protein
MVVLVPPLPCTQQPSWVSFVNHACNQPSWWARQGERARLGLVVVQGHHIACPFCSAEYLTAEVLELAGNASKDLKVRQPRQQRPVQAAFCCAVLATLAGRCPLC